jgi:SAM-dependent methyltransferase
MRDPAAAAPATADLLARAEALERDAAESRVAFLAGCLAGSPAGWRAEGGGPSSPLLDVGCGNGYGVDAWRRGGARAFGVDISFYRLGRWAAMPRDRKPLLLADAAHLPFADGPFAAVVSSGMIEHVGVAESAPPYTVTALPDQAVRRAAVVRELERVAAADAPVVVDCPNGSFPVDFWHGDRLGALRFHRTPDALLPTFADLATWARAAGRSAALQPLRDRLRFRQVGSRWWGRLLAPLARLYLRGLDLLVAAGLSALPARLYPYLVVVLRRSV